MNDCSGLLAADAPPILSFKVLCTLSKKPRLWIDMTGDTDEVFWLLINVLEILWIMCICLDERWFKAREKKGANIFLAMHTSQNAIPWRINGHSDLILLNHNWIWSVKRLINDESKQTQKKKKKDQRWELLCVCVCGWYSEYGRTLRRFLAMNIRPWWARSPKNSFEKNKDSVRYMFWQKYILLEKRWMAKRCRFLGLLHTKEDFLNLVCVRISYQIEQSTDLADLSCLTLCLRGFVMSRSRRVFVWMQMIVQQMTTAVIVLAKFPKIQQANVSDVMITLASIGWHKPSVYSVIVTLARTNVFSGGWWRTLMSSKWTGKDLAYFVMKR